jgi:xyloglucan-specific exo-beta-1,4-glucanase
VRSSPSRSLRRLLAGTLAFVVPAAVAVIVAGAPASPAAVAATTWRNAEIGGGGFVPGIVFNQTEPGLAYARTDIGGAYRWNAATGRWIPLLDSVGWADWGHNGVVSLATDPVDPNRVYAAAGMYTNSWDPNNGAVLRSADRGATWQASALPFKLGGNMPASGSRSTRTATASSTSAHRAATGSGAAPTPASRGRR